MNSSTIIIAAISLIPALGLAICIFFLDRMEKEPFRLLFALFILGAGFYFPAQYASGWVSRLFDSAMSGEMSFSLTSVISYTSLPAQMVHQIMIALFAVAFVEELAKWLVMKLVAHRAPDFDCFFDGIVYGAFTAFGFAACESVFYAIRFGADTLLLRALLHLPVQLMFGTLMGLLYSAAREAESRGHEGAKGLSLFGALILPTLVHGVYSYLQISDSISAESARIVYMIILSIVSFLIISVSSQNDHWFGDISTEGGMRAQKEKRKRRPRNRKVFRHTMRTLYFILSLLTLLGSSPLLSMPQKKYDQFLKSVDQFFRDREKRKAEKEKALEDAIEGITENTSDDTSGVDLSQVLDEVLNQTGQTEAQNQTTQTEAQDQTSQTQTQTQDQTGQTEAQDKTSQTQDQTSQTEAPDQTETTQTLQASEPVYSRYENLGVNGKKMYEAIDAKLSSGENTSQVEHLSGEVTQDEIENAVYAVYYDHPEYFWINGGYTYWTTKKGNETTVKIENHTYDFWDYTTDHSGYRARLEAAAEEAAEAARKEEGTFNQVKFVHDYLCRNAVYDNDSFAELNSTVHTSKNWDYCHSAYGCLINHLCVCDGYSKAFQMILQKLGIPCYYTEGTGKTGAHAWNFLMLDGDYYYMDVTWDDPDDVNHTDFVMYDYYCNTYNGILRDHAFMTEERNFWYPQCSATACDYFVHEGLDLADYDLAKIEQLAARSGGGTLAVRFSSPGVSSLAVQKLMKEGEIYQVMNNVDVYYYEDQTLYVLPT